MMVTPTCSEKDNMLPFPKIMGILNVTPDSFSDGRKYFDLNSALRHADAMIENSASIIDIGGESTRPGAAPIDTEAELSRVIPVIQAIRKKYPEIILSIDTVKYDVATAAINEGADIINDISGLNNDFRLAELASRHHKSLIIMHMLGTPASMQVNPQYNDVTEEVYNFLSSRVDQAKKIGVTDIIVDPGIGFGKTVEHNLELLRNLDRFSDIGCKVLLGISRKSFIGKTLGIDNPADRDVQTALYHAVLLSKKIGIIRVHNVELISQLKKIYELLSTDY